MIANPNSIEQLAIQIKNGIIINVNTSVKNIINVKKDYSWNPSTCICENNTYLKSVVANSVNVFIEIMNAVDNVSTNVTNTIPTNMTDTILANVTSTVQINCDDKNVRYKMDWYILHTFL